MQWNKQQKVGLLSLIFLITTPVCAKGNFYFGAGVGPEMTNFSQNTHTTQPGNFDVTDNTKLAASGVFGTLFGGYGWHLQRYYLAGELNANLSSANFKSSNNEILHSSLSNTRYSIQRSYGLSFIPGFMLVDQTLLYIRLAYASGNFKITTNDTSLKSINRYLNGFRYGVGIKQSLANNFSFRMEYSHINYQTTSFNAVDGMTQKATHISPEVGMVEFGLVYDFV